MPGSRCPLTLRLLNGVEGSGMDVQWLIIARACSRDSEGNLDIEGIFQRIAFDAPPYRASFVLIAKIQATPLEVGEPTVRGRREKHRGTWGRSSGTCRLMSRSLLLFAGVLLFLTGCAYLGATRPVVPFSIPLSESPEEFRWPPFKWPHGAVLSYQLHGFVEMTVKGQTSTQGLAQVRTLETKGQTVNGLTRVEFQLAGKPQAALFFDSGGELVDIEAVTSEAADELKGLLGWSTLPSVRTWMSEVLRINAPREIEIASAEVFPGERWERARMAMSPMLRFTVTYQGFRRLGDQAVAVVVTKISNTAPVEQIDKDGKPVTVESAVSEQTDYVHPMYGYTLASYATVSSRVSSAAKGPIIDMLVIQSATLDRGRSKGLSYH